MPCASGDYSSAYLAKLQRSDTAGKRGGSPYSEASGWSGDCSSSLALRSRRRIVSAMHSTTVCLTVTLMDLFLWVASTSRSYESV